MKLTPTLAALLRDAAICATRNAPLYYTKGGFRRMQGNRHPGRIHAFGTVAAAERRGLVQTTGAAPHRKLYITGTGLDAHATLKRQRG